MKSIRHRLTLLIDTFGTVKKKKTLMLFKFFMPGKSKSQRRFNSAGIFA